MRTYQFGPWLIEPALNKISKNGTAHHLEPQVMGVLLYLIENHSKVVSKQELMEAIWPDVVVTENVLSRCISLLRKALGDDPKFPKYIETISKSGYRLIPTVQVSGAETDQPKGLRAVLRSQILRPVTFVVILFLLITVTATITQVIDRGDKDSMLYPVPASLLEGSEWYPNISPDGKYLAYSWRGPDQDNSDLYVKLIDSESSLQLSNTPGNESGAAWTPDSKYLIFMRKRVDCGIFRVSVLGGEEEKIGDCLERAYGSIDVSSDGKWVVANGATADGRSRNIKLVEISSGAVQHISNPDPLARGDFDPAFSPDDRFIAFRRKYNAVDEDLFIYDLSTKNTRRITEEHSVILGHDWWSENEIAYASQKSGHYQLWKLDLTTNQSTLMPLADYQLIQPQVPGQGKLTYMKVADEVNLWSLTRNESGEYDAAKWMATAAIEKHPSISPDGKYVAYLSNEGGNFEIWLADIDGKNKKELTQLEGDLPGNPRWSENSETIIFDLQRGNQSEIFRINIRGGGLTNLTNLPSNEQVAALSADGKELFFGSDRSGQWQIWKKDLETEELEQLTESTGYGLTLDHANNAFYYARWDTVGLWQYSFDTKDIKPIANISPRLWGSIALGNNLVYAHGVGSPPAIISVDMSKQIPTTIFTLEGKQPYPNQSITATPDGSYIIFTQIDRSDSDIMIAEIAAN